MLVDLKAYGSRSKLVGPIPPKVGIDRSWEQNKGVMLDPISLKHSKLI